MIIKQGQVRYIKDGDSRNYPLGLTAKDLVSGTVFNDIVKITELSISGYLGLKFYLNDTTTPLMILPDSLNEDPINPGLTYMWKLNTDLISDFPIYTIKLDARTLNDFLLYNNHVNNTEYIFISYTYQINN